MEFLSRHRVSIGYLSPSRPQASADGDREHIAAQKATMHQLLPLAGTSGRSSGSNSKMISPLIPRPTIPVTLDSKSMIKKALHPPFLPASPPYAETFRMNPNFSVPSRAFSTRGMNCQSSMNGTFTAKRRMSACRKYAGSAPRMRSNPTPAARQLKKGNDSSQEACFAGSHSVLHEQQRAGS